MVVTNELKEAAPVTAPVALNTLGVNVFTAPVKAVAGHKKPGAPDSPSAIQDTKRYLEDFDRVQKTATSDQELFDQMTVLYPD